MWPRDFNQRLKSWVDLRDSVAFISKESALLTVDNWWQQTPWRPYYLHWDDRATWPDPWQLLSDDVYCDLARALGIVYTLSMARPQDCMDLEICETDQGNLVSIDQGKYILNWVPGQLLNMRSHTLTIKRTLPGASLPLPRT